MSHFTVILNCPECWLPNCAETESSPGDIIEDMNLLTFQPSPVTTAFHTVDCTSHLPNWGVFNSDGEELSLGAAATGRGKSLGDVLVHAYTRNAGRTFHALRGELTPNTSSNIYPQVCECEFLGSSLLAGMFSLCMQEFRLGGLYTGSMN